MFWLTGYDVGMKLLVSHNEETDAVPFIDTYLHNDSNVHRIRRFNIAAVIEIAIDGTDLGDL